MTTSSPTNSLDDAEYGENVDSTTHDQLVSTLEIIGSSEILSFLGDDLHNLADL